MKKYLLLSLGISTSLLVSVPPMVKADSANPSQMTVQNFVESSKSSQDTSQSNLVTNGDFETGDTTGWNFDPLSVNSKFNVQNRNNNLQGYIYDGGTVSQEIPVVGGESFKFSMDFSQKYSGYRTEVTITALDETGKRIKDVFYKDSNEQEGNVSSGSITVPQNTKNLLIKITTTTNSEAYIDNISLETVTQTPISFKDKVLEKEVKKALQLSDEDVITEENILGLEQLRTKEAGITDLSGLEYARNLKLVTFDKENIASLSPLETLPYLYSVGVPRCSQLPMSEVLKLKHLTELDLSELKYSQEEFDHLSSYHNMTFLVLNGCGLKNISFMSSMHSLTQVQVTGNELNSLESLENSADTIEVIAASSNQIEKIELNNFPKLQGLGLKDNNITSITLRNLPVLKTLMLDRNKISNITDWENLPKVTDFSIAYNTDIQDINFLSTMPKIDTLTLEGCQKIKDFNILRNLHDLKNLYLGYNNLNNNQIKNIGSLPNLDLLGLNGNKLTDISFIAQFPKLTKLAVMNNSISDISMLPNNITCVATQQNIDLPETKVNIGTPIVLKGINGEVPLLSNWVGQGNLNEEGDHQTLTWTTPGSNSFDFASNDGSFSGTVKQKVKL